MHLRKLLFQEVVGFSPIWEGAEACELLSMCPCLPSSSTSAFDHPEHRKTFLWHSGSSSLGGRTLQEREGTGQKGVCAETAGTGQADRLSLVGFMAPGRWQVPHAPAVQEPPSHGPQPPESPLVSAAGPEQRI